MAILSDFSPYPLCTPWRRANVTIAQDEYDLLREAAERIYNLERVRPKTTAEWLRGAFDPPMSQPVYIHPEDNPRPLEIFRMDNGTRVEIRGERPIDAATGRPWQAGPRPQPKPKRAPGPRGWQEPIERIQPIRIEGEPEPEPAPAWLQALAIGPGTEPAAVYHPLSGGAARPPDRAPGEKPKPRKANRKPPKTGKKAAAPMNVTAEFTRVKRQA